MENKIKLFLSILLLISSSGCKNPLTGTGESVIDDGFDNDTNVELPSVSFEIDLPLPAMNSVNAPAYPITGTCDPGGSAVVTLIGGPDVTETVNCGSDGRFSTVLDVTGVTSNPPNISVSQGEAVAPLDLSDLPLNDQTAIVNAPVASPPGGPVGGPTASYALGIICNEIGEVVSISGAGLNPSPQTHTCASTGADTFNLSLTSGVETTAPNSLSISSTDANGNPTTNDDAVIVDIDTLGPTVSVVAGADIIQSQSGDVTVTLTDSNLGSVNYNVSGSINSDTTSILCTTNPCSGSMVSGANIGTMTFTVAAGTVSDSLGNLNVSASSDSLDVTAAGALGFNVLPVLNAVNAASYPVSGSCDDALGNVTVTVGTPDVMQSFACTAPGVFSGNMPSLTGVAVNPAVITVSQGATTVTASPAPVNDQTPILNAPTVVSPGIFVGSVSYNVSIGCNEIGEVVTVSGAGLSPASQEFTCPNAGASGIVLLLASGVETTAPNVLTISSIDAGGNPTVNDSSTIVNIDTLAPTVSVAAGVDVIEGNDATFTVTVTDGSPFVAFTPSVSSGSVSSGACSSSPCTVTVMGASVGTLTMTVAIGDVSDTSSNTNLVASSDSLTVMAATLSVNNPPLANQANAAAYPVTGNCNTGGGDVTVTIGTPNTSSVVSCTGNPGTYTASLDVSSVTASPMVLTSAQGGNAESPAIAPVNDQNSILNAPTITDQVPVIGTSQMVSVTCSEIGEVVSFTGTGLNPSPQTYTCVGTSAANITLDVSSGVETGDPNTITVSSVDINGNATTNNTTFNMPIDNVIPTVAITVAENIDMANNITYSFSGTCSDDGEEVTVGVGGLVPNPQPTCSSGEWAVTGFDASSISNGMVAITADQDDEAGNSANQATVTVEKSAFLPTDLAGLVAWYDGADSSTVFSDTSCLTPTTVDGDPVRCWADKLVPGKNATNADGLTTLEKGSLNSLDSVDFNTSFLQTALSIDPALYPNLSAFAIYTPNVNNAGGLWGTDDPGWDRFVLDGDDDTLNGIVATGLNASLSVPNLYVPLTPSFHSIIYRQGVSNGTDVFVNGTNELMFTSNHVLNSSNPLQIGAIGRSNFRFQGQMSELFFYGSDLNSTDRETVEGYLACKWGRQSTLPADHPYKTSCMLNVGLQVDFSRTDATPLQLGFEGCFADTTSAVTCIYPSEYASTDDVTFTVQAPFWRTRTPVASGPYLSLSNLLIDNIVANASGQTLTIQIDGLKAGLYTLTTWHHDTEFVSASGTLTGTDSVGAFTVFANETQNGGLTAPTDVRRERFYIRVLVDNDPVNLVYTRHSGSGHININGLWLNEPEQDLVLVDGAYEYADRTHAVSCSEYLNSTSYNNEGDAVYRVDLDGAGGSPSVKVFCDMTRNGGGWMLALKTRDQVDAWYEQTASVNEMDCQSGSSANATNCSHLSMYNWTGWSEMMGDNVTGSHTSVIVKNSARTSLQNHLTGAELSDPNVYPFLTELYTGSPAGGSILHSEWNGVGDVGRYGRMLVDQASITTAIIGGRMNGSCGHTTVGNGHCSNSFASVIWFWLR